MRRSYIVLVGALVIAVIGAWWWARRDVPSTDDAAATSDGHAERGRIEGAAGGRRGDLPRLSSPGEVAGADRGATTGESGQRLALEHAYPMDSRPLAASDLQFLEPDRPPAERRPLRRQAGAPREASASMEVLFTTDRFAVTGEEALTATLAVFPVGGQAAVPLDILSAEVVTAPARGHQPEPVARLEVRDDGAGADAVAGDHTYTGIVFPGRAGLRETGPYVVRVAFRAGPVESEASQVFHYTAARDIPARFAGRMKDELQAGSLLVEVGVEVARPGTYIIEANLYGGAGEPLARASQRLELARGTQRVPLRFYGKILREAGADGPYQLGQLRGYRFAPGERPDRQMMPRWTGEHETAAYRAADFTDRPWSAGR